MKKIFTREMLTNAAVTLGVVLVALAVHEKFVAPMLKGNSVSGSTTPTVPSTTEA